MVPPEQKLPTNSAIEIELKNYVEVDTVQGELPESDENWPKGAPMAGYIKVGDKILKEKTP
jgi:hypothetical protein